MIVFQLTLSSLYTHKYYNSHNMEIIKVNNNTIILIILDISFILIITKGYNTHIYVYIKIIL